MRKLSFLGVLSTASVLLLTWWRGQSVGVDFLGNRYFRTKPRGNVPRERRWVIYAGVPEASTVPPEWHGWLHHQCKEPPSAQNPARQSWQKAPVPNLTGTDATYRPPGHILAEKKRDRATGDYESWSPPQ